MVYQDTTKISNLAVYGAYRYMLRLDIYAKLRMGLAYTRTLITGDN